MGKETGIAWTDHTWNPWQGCRKVSPGCLNCYMYRGKSRFKQDPSTVIRSSNVTFNAPLRWKEPAKVFVCSWSDFFIADADEWRGDAWEIMRRTSHLTYQLLTKRPENIAGRLPDGWPFPNVWIGVTAENQEMANWRIPILLKTPASLRFVSVEPMVSDVDLSPWIGHRISGCSAMCPWSKDRCRCQPGDCQDSSIILSGIDWVIVGGETGPAARMMRTEWAEQILDECKNTGTPFFMKQMTNKATIPDNLMVREFPLTKHV